MTRSFLTLIAGTAAGLIGSNWTVAQQILGDEHELRRQTIVGAMYGTFDKNEAEARRFWIEVSRGGVEYEDNHPTTVLDTFFKSVFEEKKKWDLNPANLYQASVYAWNAYRENKTIASVKYDTKKGLYNVAA
jgi:hypothetical protein